MDRVKPTLSDGGSKNAGWLSHDRTTILSAVGATGLYTSIDDGVSWTLRHTFWSGIKSVRELANGELLVGVSTVLGELWLSSGWANPATATWTKVLTASANANAFPNQWSLNTYQNIVLANEYGEVKDGVSNARYCWMSTDYGQTWRVIFDNGLTVNQHLHGVAYDSWWNRIWITTGDVNADWHYSDDMGSTWQTITGTPKCVTILPMPQTILFLSDGPPNGVSRIIRGSDKTQLTVDTGYAIDQSGATNYLGMTAFWAGPSFPAVLSFQADQIAMPGRVITTMDGLTFSEIWNDSITYVGHGMVACLGPTALGSYVGTLDDGRQGNASRWYAMPDTKNWLTGTGGADGKKGDGNRDVYANVDGSLTQAGIAYAVKRSAFAIRPPATGLDY